MNRLLRLFRRGFDAVRPVLPVETATRHNFMEIPTDCPQRDERLGWMGDAQTYVRTATFNADVAAFFTKWLDDVEEAQRDFGAYPDYCPYPMSHGSPQKAFGTAWTDAGSFVPGPSGRFTAIYRSLTGHWASLTRFMDWRAASMTPDGLGAGASQQSLGRLAQRERVDAG